MSHLFYQTRLRRPELDKSLGVYMWDTSGKRYLDGSSGAMVSNIGHTNSRVLVAMEKQMQRSTFGYRLHFETEAAENLASKLADLSPAGMNRAFFVSGGSEAVESALKLARQYTIAKKEPKRWKFISRTPSYHGCTFGALGITGYSPLTEPFAPMLQTMPKIPAPRAYLDGMDLNDPVTGKYYADFLEQEILANDPETVLAFIVEPIGGASTGALVPPVGYMERIGEICRQYGILLIYDEVMTGGGRTGTLFAAEHWPEVVPDIIALSKGLGGGYIPLGAMLAQDEIVEAVLDDGGFAHGFTYAGNPLACAAGFAVLNEIEREDMLGNGSRRGEELMIRLKQLMESYPFIGDVRGKGLLTAFEIVQNRETMKPFPAKMDLHLKLVDLAYENGLIIYSRRTRDGLEGEHFLVCPPLIVTSDQINEIMEKLTISLDQLTDEIKLPVERTL